MLQVNTSNPDQQALVSRLHNRFDREKSDILLMNWLTSCNLPFNIINSEAFKRWAIYNNPMLRITEIPSSNTLFALLNREYEKAIGPVTEVLQSARNLVHFTFDGWTSKRNQSFVGINAQFVDHNFKQWNFLLGLPSMGRSHTGEHLADEVADVVAFFGLENKLVTFPLQSH
jgi:hypothetical protein